MGIGMVWVTVLTLALSSSIDNFGVGISYGIRGIRLSFLSNFIISVIAFVFSEVGIVSGQYLSHVLPGMLSNLIGALFLIVIGLRIVLLTIPKKKKKAPPEEAPEALTVVTASSDKNANYKDYLSQPEQADLDHSGDIGFFEAIVLGIAVSINSLTNGIGAGLIGLSPFAISLSAAIFSFLALWWGCLVGKKVAGIRIGSWTLGQFSTVLSGVILLLVGFHAIYTR
ncbi:MAG: sporulation membrane protein YtaF [Tumebacillaceae bacterium]